MSQSPAMVWWAPEELDREGEASVRGGPWEAIEDTDLLEPMPMATLLDRRLWPECLEMLRRHVFPLVERFHDALLPARLEFWRDGGYQRVALDFRIGNFGVTGGFYLNSLLGIGVPDESFLRRGGAQIPRFGRMMGEPYSSDGAGFLRQLVVTYAEFEFAAPDLPALLRGAGHYANGRTSAGEGWLIPVQPPFCPFADRGTCSEFRMLSSFCEAMAGARSQGMCESEGGRGRFSGFLRALVSGPCCVSCVGAFVQFRLLFPSIEVFVAAGKPRSALQRR